MENLFIFIPPSPENSSLAEFFLWRAQNRTLDSELFYGILSISFILNWTPISLKGGDRPATENTHVLIETAQIHSHGSELLSEKSRTIRI